MKKAFYLSLTACMLFTMAQAQTPGKKKFELYHGEPAIVKKVSELKEMAAKMENKKPLKPFDKEIEIRIDEVKHFRERIQNFSKGKEIPGADQETEKAESTIVPNDNSTTQRVWSNFLASTFDEFPFFAPPDPNGAVGPSQVVVVTNNMLKVFEKKAVTDAPLVSYKGALQTPAPAQFAIPTYFFFAPYSSDSTFIYASDPHVRYDRLSKRWFIVAIEVDPNNLHNNYIMLAVSDGDRITDASSFSFFRFHSSRLPFSSNTQAPLFDYPRLGIDNNAVLIGGSAYFTHNTDCGTSYDSLYSVGFAIDKKRLLRGELAFYALKIGSWQFNQGTGFGIIIPQAVYNDDPQAPKSFFAGMNWTPGSDPSDGIALAALTYDKNGELADLSETTVPVGRYQFPRDITAPGSPMRIDPVDNRFFEVSIRKNKLTGKSALWTAHAVGVNQSGSFVPDSVFVQQARTGSRWYQVKNIYTMPSVAQAGTLYDDSKASGRRASNYFNPSIAANGQGNVVLGGTTSAYNRYLNAFISGRYYSDAEGTLGDVQRVTATSAIYALNFGYYVDRWGDYSQTVVDPLDDQTMWTFQEYATSDDNYGVRAVQVKAPPPATPLPLDAISNKDNLWITVKGVSVDHSGFFDPGNDKGGPGYNRLSVKVTGGLIASKIRFDSPTQIRFWLDARNKPVGKYTVIITNPDGQVVTTELEITAQTMTSVTATKDLQQKVQEYSTSSSVTPNPTPGNFTLQLNAAKDWTARVVLMDVTGKQLSVSTHAIGKGVNNIALSLAGYENGTYLAAVYNQAHVLISLQKIVKQ